MESRGVHVWMVQCGGIRGYVESCKSPKGKDSIWMLYFKVLLQGTCVSHSFCFNVTIILTTY